MTTKPSPLNWYFPLRRPHAGVTLGNGLQGVLIWGENTLLLTVARASFWDHRGGHDILPTTNFNAVRHALEIKDDAALAALFPRRAPGTPFLQQMVGAFEGYHAMLVTTSGPDGTKRFSLPISVSPEFGGSDPKQCWGRDASFQLAALHAAIHDLQAVAPLLGQPADPRTHPR